MTREDPESTWSICQIGASRLKAAKVRKRLSLETIAKVCGSSKSVIGNILNRKQVTCSFLPRLCAVLELPTAAALLDDELEVRAVAALMSLRSTDPAEARRAVRDLEFTANGLRRSPPDRDDADPMRPR